MKEDFLKVFNNLPIPERSMPIYVDKKWGVMSWIVVYQEVSAESPLGDAALETLRKLKII